MKKALSLLVVCFYTSVVAHSQFVTQEYKIFNHIDLGVTAGSTGIGLEASSPVGQYLHVRTGVLAGMTSSVISSMATICL